MKKCPRRGKENTNNSKYCEYSGESLTSNSKGNNHLTLKEGIL